MKIDKLNNDVFYDYASLKTGVNVRLYHHDLTLTRKKDGIVLVVFLGGEVEDERAFKFGDDYCSYRRGHNQDLKDLSYDWVNYLIETENQLDKNDLDLIVDMYNQRIENTIAKYSSQMRKNLIMKNSDKSI